MTRERRSRIAEVRALYTGETRAQAIEALSPGHTPLPAANSTDQALLETEILLAVMQSQYMFTEYSFGIRRVRPAPTTLLLEVESQQRAIEILQHVLPTHHSETGVQGVEGVWVQPPRANRVVLRRVDTSASLCLCGLTTHGWHRALEAVTHTATEAGHKSLWTRPRWTEHEHPSTSRGHRSQWVQMLRAGAWSGSGLLRRLPLLHTISTADVVSGYKGLPIAGYEGRRRPLRWVITIRHRPGIAQRRDELVAALTNGMFGLPIERAAHLDRTFPDLPPTLIRLDDLQRTSLFEFRFDTFDYFTGKPEHQALYTRICKRIAAAQAISIQSMLSRLARGQR